MRGDFGLRESCSRWRPRRWPPSAWPQSWHGSAGSRADRCASGRNFAIALRILAAEQNIAFLVALAFAVAAAANLPTFLYSLYWQRFNTRGALLSMYGGLISTIVLIVFSPAMSGAKTAMLRNVDLTRNSRCAP
jgi:Sodium:solute symporter family